VLSAGNRHSYQFKLISIIYHRATRNLPRSGSGAVIRARRRGRCFFLCYELQADANGDMGLRNECAKLSRTLLTLNSRLGMTGRTKIAPSSTSGG